MNTVENLSIINKVKAVIEKSKKFQPVKDDYYIESTLIAKYFATVKLPEHYSRLDAHILLKWLRALFYIEENFSPASEYEKPLKISALDIRDIATECVDLNLRPADIEVLALFCHTVFIDNQWYKASKATASEAGNLVKFIRKNKWLLEIVESYLKDFKAIEIVNELKTFNVDEELLVDANLNGVYK